MKFNIITPTVQRDSLIKCCESIDEQTFSDWRHIVMIDHNFRDNEMLREILHPRRYVYQCARPHNNGGNTCRHDAWAFASGEWVYYLDDDNYLASPFALGEIAHYVEGIEEKWALFPIHRHGSRFYFDPPQPCYFDTGNAVVRREIARIAVDIRPARDAVWLEETLKKHPYRAFPEA